MVRWVRFLMLGVAVSTWTAAADAKMNDEAAFQRILEQYPQNVQVQLPRIEGKIRYYLLAAFVDDDIIVSLTNQVSSFGDAFSLMQVDCARKQYREIGATFKSPEEMDISRPSDWTSLVRGSSKSDTVNFLCGNETESWGLRPAEQ